MDGVTNAQVTTPTTGEPVRCKSCDAPLDFGDKFVDWSALRVNRHHDEFVCLNATIRERNALRADIARLTAERDRYEAELKRCVHEALQHSHTPEQLAAMMDAWPDASTQVHAVMHSYDECRDALATAQREAERGCVTNAKITAVCQALDIQDFDHVAQVIGTFVSLPITPAPEAGR